MLARWRQPRDYRHWLDSAPRRAETGLRDLIQRMALGNAHYGYRRIAALLRREGWQVNHNAFYGSCVKTICCACAQDLCSCDDKFEAWLASRAEPRQGHDPKRGEPAMGCRYHVRASG
ncbi:IS3 family transposase [Mesorhizobium sp. M0684]|uniref:IS3 family transposase n=1 Tax=Mesorhizobium sp. M0684 TaxID=2956986 RepID=UPI00333CAFAF